jgi:hypothetical protein
VVCPATNSDSASPRSKGILPVSKKNKINKIGSTGSKIKNVQVYEYWNDTIWKNEKDSNIVIIYIKKKLINTSKFNVVTKTRVEDKTAYLFLLIHPTKNMSIEKNIDNTPINSKLYSISQTAKFGDQIKLTQNK